MNETEIQMIKDMKQRLVEQIQILLDNPSTICGAPLNPNESLEQIMANTNCDLAMARRIQEYRRREARGVTLPTTKWIMEKCGLTLEEADRYRQELIMEIEKLRRNATRSGG